MIAATITAAKPTAVAACRGSIARRPRASRADATRRGIFDFSISFEGAATSLCRGSSPVPLSGAPGVCGSARATGDEVSDAWSSSGAESAAAAVAVASPTR